MEKCDHDLRSRLTLENIYLEERKRIAIDLKGAQDYLHKIGLWHMDVKPSNILLKNGKPKLCDFGVSIAQGTRRGFFEMGYCRRGASFQNIQYLRNEC